MHKIAIIVALVTICLGVVWDFLIIILGCSAGNSFCSAVRELNAKSDGLVALFALALYIHIFLLQYLPSLWKS